MVEPRFAFLFLQEHPYARQMLQSLLGAGFVPRLVVEEASDLAREERDKFLERIGDHPVAPSMAEQIRVHGIPSHKVEAHRSETILECLEGEELDLIVLGGTRIIRGPVLSHPLHGVINAHPGWLPDCRGSASPAWSVYHDIPIGASVHFCDDGIDTGDLLLRQRMAVRAGMTYEDLCYGTLVLAGELMRDALRAFVQGLWPQMRQVQPESAWPTFKNAPDAVLEAVRDKLAAGTYRHYS